MVITYILFVIGLYLLVKSADWIVDSSSSLAKKFGISNLIIGLTIVAFGTSLPELVVNLFAAFRGSGEVAFGNIIGSNISNILLILGILAIIGNIKLRRKTVWEEIPFALLAAFMLFVLTDNIFSGGGVLTRQDGIILLSLFGVFLFYIFKTGKISDKFFDVSAIVEKSNIFIGLKLILGLVGIYFGGKFVVNGAINIATLLGLSEYLISATIIAVGTSLPELVVSVVAMWKKNIDLAVGNIIGSNVFNVFWVLGIVPLIQPITAPAFVGFDIAIMFLATLLLFIFMFIGKKGEMSRTEGIISLIAYAMYLWFIAIRG